MYLKNEQEIIKNWEYTKPPLVSICCITYNHEPYIQDAIESFLMQDTSFPFEVIIHDDASTDRTTEIILEFYKKYPYIIKPIFQKENQYSKGIMVSSAFVWPKSQGQYIALCEGDDYWTNPNKLSIQTTAMQMDRTIDMSFHPTAILGSKKLIADYYKSNSIIACDKFIASNSKFCQTSSTMFRSNILQNLPIWFNDLFIGDYYTWILGSTRGGALFIPKIMSKYRPATPGSWTRRSKKLDYIFKYTMNSINKLDEINKYYKYKYNDSINIKKAFLLMNLYLSCLRYNQAGQIAQYIEESIETYNLKNKQLLLYSLRKHPKISKWFLMIFDTIKKFY